MEARAIEATAQTQNANVVKMPQSNAVNLFAFPSIDRAWKFAEVLSHSEIIPDIFRGNTASCLIALDMANRMKRSPMEVMQAMYVVHGKPGFSASFLIALINSCGLFERLKFEYSGKEGTLEWGCRAWTTEKATGEKLVGPLITMKMAQEEGWLSNKKWKTMPETMLQYRAASFFSRAYCPDLTGGMHSVDELTDISTDDSGATSAATLQKELLEEPVKQPEPVDVELVEQGTVEATESNHIADAGKMVKPANSKDSAEDEITPFKSGLTPLELLRKEVQTLLGPEPDGLGLREDEQEAYLMDITGKTSIKSIPEAGLRTVVKAARAQLEKRAEREC